MERNLLVYVFVNALMIAIDRGGANDRFLGLDFAHFIIIGWASASPAMPSPCSAGSKRSRSFTPSRRIGRAAAKQQATGSRPSAVGQNWAAVKWWRRSLREV